MPIPQPSSLFHSIVDLLAEGESLTLATIVSRSGSAPRAMGTRMAIRTDGTMVGTIGGGMLEAQVLALAREVFSRGQAVLKQYALNTQNTGQMGMACGGVVQILFQFLDAGRAENHELFKEIVSALDAGEKAWLVVALPSGLDSPEPIVQGLGKVEGMIVGDLDRQAVQNLITRAGSGRPECISDQGKRYLVEPLCHQSSIYIFGAGHVARQLAPMAKRVGFRTVVLDDRHEFANRSHFPEADAVIVVHSFDSALKRLKIESDSYLVIVTRGHAYDQAVLHQALATRACYIGMMASRRKRDAIFAALAEEGVPQKDFDRVSSPIGLAIGAETPEEIAVSIVAQLIQTKATRQNR